MSNRNAILEPLYLPSSDFKIFEVGPSKIRITGECAHAGAVSKNGYQYVGEALMKSTNTFIGKPCLPNHNPKEVIGNVELMDYKNNALCYTIMINKPLHVERVREYARNPTTSLLRGVSIGANYLYAKCSKCGKSFTEETLWRKHMNDEEFIKDLPLEPHGIIGTDISLVYAPETPGLETSISLAETANGFKKLEEILLKEHPEPIEEQKKESEGTPSFNRNPYVKEERMSQEELKRLENAFGSGYGFSPIKPQVSAHAEVTPAPVVLKPLGEPFAGYVDMNDCISKNSDKDNPSGYCAVIMRTAEEVKRDDVGKLLEDLQDSISEVDNIRFRGIMKRADSNVEDSKANEILAEAIAREAEFKLKGLQEQLRLAHEDNEKLSNDVEPNRKIAEYTQAIHSENKTLQERLDKAENRAANAENQLDKVKGNFKGKTKEITQNSGTPSFNRDPYAKE